MNLDSLPSLDRRRDSEVINGDFNPKPDYAR
jgi:hypothetical protein